jgi:hypothetical protein
LYTNEELSAAAAADDDYDSKKRKILSLFIILDVQNLTLM